MTEPKVSMSVSVTPSMFTALEEIQEKRAQEDGDVLNRSELVREALRGYYNLDE